MGSNPLMGKKKQPPWGTAGTYYSAKKREPKHFFGRFWQKNQYVSNNEIFGGFA